MNRAVVLRAVLRSVAVAIAIAAVVDPVITRTRPGPTTVVVAHLASASAVPAASAIQAALPHAEVLTREADSRRLPCAPNESCVIVADGSVDVHLPDDRRAPVSLIRLAVPDGPNLVVRSVVVPRAQHGAGAAVARVTMGGSNLQGRRTEVRVTDGAATVGSMVHEWAADGDVTVDVPWWPLGDGARTLRVAAAPFDGEATVIDNAVEVGVTVSSSPIRVLVFDARPSWSSTFVRRALEDDPRFRVEHRVGLAPALTAGTTGGRLESAILDAVPIAMIGSPDGLSAADVALLERFVQVRGGTLVLLPDRPASGASSRLFTGRWTEHLEASASAVGSLRASETLRLPEPSPFDVVLGAAKGVPAIVLSPRGNGRIVVSGAMDAWRYRDADGGAFDRFWRSLVLESAADGAALRLSLADRIAAPGTHLPFTVRHRQMDADAQRTALASASCGGEAAQVIRLWPDGAAGTFTGVVPVNGDGPCEVRVEVEGGVAAADAIAVTTGPTRTVAGVLSKLEHFARRTGGVVASTGDLAAVTRALGAEAPRPDEPAPFFPMRSPWWMSPFVACLGVEWWLRRRAGLR